MVKLSAHCSHQALFLFTNPWQTNQQMALASVYIILIYQFACYQNSWYFGTQNNSHTRTHTNNNPWWKAKLSHSTKNIRKNKVADKMTVYPQSVSYWSQYDGSANWTERQPDPPANTPDPLSSRAYTYIHQCNMVIFPRTDREMDLPTSAVGFPNRQTD